MSIATGEGDEFPCVMIGNKVDLIQSDLVQEDPDASQPACQLGVEQLQTEHTSSSNAVQVSEMELWCRENSSENIPFFVTSTKTMQGVSEAFQVRVINSHPHSQLHASI